MKSATNAAVVLAVAAVAAAGLVLRASRLPTAAAEGAGDRTPVLVELFTSEGCSSCPPADALLQRLVETQPVEGAQVIALGQHVDYWDQLGWRDRFSSPTFTNRQQAYGFKFRVDAIYTPQLVVDGAAELVGSDERGAVRAIARAAGQPHGRLDVAVEEASAGALRIRVTPHDLPAPGKGDRDEILVALVENHLRSEVRRGENRGRTLSHAAVVRSLVSAGEAAGSGPLTSPPLPIAADWRRGELAAVAFVQESRSRRVVASGSSPVPGAR